MIQRNSHGIMTSLISQDQYEELLDELTSYRSKTQLDKDPVALGLKSFNDKLADIQAARERVSAILLEAIWNKQQAEQLMTEAEQDFDSKKNIALATDASVKGLRSTDLRVAKISVDNPTEVTNVQCAKYEFAKAEAFLKTVYSVSTNLETKNENLLSQINVVRMQVNIDPSLRDEIRIRG